MHLDDGHSVGDLKPACGTSDADDVVPAPPEIYVAILHERLDG
jgi:hypothetical protein